MILVEEPLFRMRTQGGLATQDAFRWPSRFYDQVRRLAAKVAQSDSARPTAAQIDAHERYTRLLRTSEGQWRELVEKDLASFNRMLKDQNIPSVILVEPN